MRRLITSFLTALALVLLVGVEARAVQIRRGMAVDSNVVVKVWNPSGTLKLVAWDRDSLHVEGTAPKWAQFFFSGVRGGVKFGIEEDVKGELPKVAMTVWVPRGSRVSAKTVDATIEADNVSGYYTTVSGGMRVTGSLRELQVESLRGAIDVDVRAPWVRVMGGEGIPLSIGGSIRRYGQWNTLPLAGPPFRKKKCLLSWRMIVQSRLHLSLNNTLRLC